MCVDVMLRKAGIAFVITLGVLLSPALHAGPEIQTWITENGARVYYVHAPDLPILDVRVVFDAGSARDGDKPGLASLTNSMLNEGAGDWDATQLAERLENVGAQLGMGSMRDMAWVSVRTLTEQAAMDTALETLRTILTKPTFPLVEMERLRNTTLVGLRQGEQDAGTVGDKALYRYLYGDHPYASYPSGTAESVKSMTLDDIKSFYGAHYAARNAVVAIVGAVDRVAAGQVAQRVVGGLPGGEAPPDLPIVALAADPGTHHVSFPSSQTHLYLAQRGIRRGDPDYFPLYVGNHILGGSGLVSLLSEEVREKRGLSYSVFSYFLLMRRAGPFEMGLQTQNAQAGEALGVMMNTLRQFIENGPTDEQLVAAKQNITGGFPLRIASNKDVVEYIAMIGFYELPLDYLDTFVGNVDTVTAEQVRDAFQRRVDPEGFVIVQVGPNPAKAVEADQSAQTPTKPVEAPAQVTAEDTGKTAAEAPQSTPVAEQATATAVPSEAKSKPEPQSKAEAAAEPTPKGVPVEAAAEPIEAAKDTAGEQVPPTTPTTQPSAPAINGATQSR